MAKCAHRRCSRIDGERVCRVSVFVMVDGEPIVAEPPARAADRRPARPHARIQRRTAPRVAVLAAERHRVRSQPACCLASRCINQTLPHAERCKAREAAYSRRIPSNAKLPLPFEPTKNWTITLFRASLQARPVTALACTRTGTAAQCGRLHPLQRRWKKSEALDGVVAHEPATHAPAPQCNHGIWVLSDCVQVLQSLRQFRHEATELVVLGVAENPPRGS